MRKANMYRYKLKENDIFQAIDGAKQGLAEVIAKRILKNAELSAQTNWPLSEISARKSTISDNNSAH